MEFIEMDISGLFLIKPKKFEDIRGRFVKTFHRETLESYNLNSDFKESFYSISQKNVLRGMHFQTPPYDHEKLVYVPDGSILDVVLDIRKSSPTFGKFVAQKLNAENAHMFYIPKGCAHGFLSLEDNTNVTYMQTTMYAENNDSGINYNSFGFDWNAKSAIISDRDKSFVDFDDYITPFE
jgi:dTDP-4-dehydrorhamnose 3,5-epimerase/CDP-3, 6-dideoxy-D-glycero-D-glycero-4-hexulose-5-epimerase